MALRRTANYATPETQVCSTSFTAVGRHWHMAATGGSTTQSCITWLKSWRHADLRQTLPLPRQINFVREGDQDLSNTSRAWSLLTPKAEWALMVDLNQHLRFPQEIMLTSLWPDIILWSSLTKTVIMVELTVPWEEGSKGGSLCAWPASLLPVH